MGLIALIAFWVAVGLLFVNLGWKPALILAGLWIAGTVVFNLLGLHGFAFMAYQAVLAVAGFIYLKVASVRI